MWPHKFQLRSTLNRDIVMGVNEMFIVCVGLVFRSKYVQVPIICSLQYRIYINTVGVDPHSDLLHICIVKPKNTRSLTFVGTLDIFVRKNFNLLMPIHAILASTTGGFNKVLIGTKCRLYSTCHDGKDWRQQSHVCFEKSLKYNLKWDFWY